MVGAHASGQDSLGDFQNVLVFITVSETSLMQELNNSHLHTIVAHSLNVIPTFGGRAKCTQQGSLVQQSIANKDMIYKLQITTKKVTK